MTENDKSNSQLIIDELRETIKQQDIELVRLRAVIDNLPGSIYWKDVHGTYLGRNAYAAEKMQAIRLEDCVLKDAVVGKTDYDFFSKEVADQYRKHDLEVMQSGKEISTEEIVTLPNGKKLVQLSRKKPLYNNANLIGIVGNTVCITYFKEIESELVLAKQKAK
jgi:two-component system aerobic respiration control sensor histidine kinase ArcB